LINAKDPVMSRIFCFIISAYIRTFIDKRIHIFMKRILTALLISGLLTSCNDNTKAPESQKETDTAVIETPFLNFSLIKTLPHDTTSYTQGLLFYNGQVFESTGSPKEQKQTRSVVGVLDPASGKINVKAELDREKYFGEGIAVLHNKIYQLTWLNQTGFIYDAKTFKQLGQFKFENKEGWGLTTDGTYLILSDGTNTLTYLDPETFKAVKTIQTSYTNLNELEFIQGHIYANVYQKNFIIKIDPSNGNVTGVLDLSPLVLKAQRASRNSEVLNGIAFDSISNKLLVTGKLWPHVYQIELSR
jgi:glutamine cyclotransferase